MRDTPAFLNAYLKYQTVERILLNTFISQPIRFYPTARLSIISTSHLKILRKDILFHPISGNINYQSEGFYSWATTLALVATSRRATTEII